MSERLTLTVPEAAELLGVSRGAAYEAARAGELPVVKIGRRLLVPRAQLFALLGEQLRNGRTPAANGGPNNRPAGQERSSSDEELYYQHQPAP